MISLYIDEDSQGHALVNGLRSPGIDLLTVAEAGNLGISDEQHLIFAAAQRRTLFSCDVDDFARINHRWLSEGRHHAGLVLVKPQQTPVGDVIRALVRLSEALEPSGMEDPLEYLSSWIVRT